MKNVTIELTLEEFVKYGAIGLRLYYDAALKNRKNKHGLSKRGMEMDVNAFIAEGAIHKMLGREFDKDKLGQFKNADVVGTRVQVRSTTLEGGRLIIREDDNMDHYYILTTVEGTRIVAVGWMYGADAAKEKYLFSNSNRPPAFFVPQGDLHPFPLPPNALHTNE